MTEGAPTSRCGYIFLDEAGNFDFSPKGTDHYILASMYCERPFRFNTLFDSYRYDLIEFGLDTEFFHCADDNQHVRRRVFHMIAQDCGDLRIDSVVTEKRKTGPALQDPVKFYSKMIGYLLRHVIGQVNGDHIDELIIITDQIPVSKKRQAIEKAIKQTLTAMLPHDCRYRIYHHSSKSHVGLQIVDYCNWAIFRKWERRDLNFYSAIRHHIKSEFDIFRSGKKHYS